MSIQAAVAVEGSTAVVKGCMTAAAVEIGNVAAEGGTATAAVVKKGTATAEEEGGRHGGECMPHVVSQGEGGGDVRLTSSVAGGNNDFFFGVFSPFSGIACHCSLRVRRQKRRNRDWIKTFGSAR
jgi:hypothetical protein